MAYTAKNIRNIAILGHLGSGKTSLVESLAFLTGITKQKGSVEKKNTISDYLLEEQNKLSSLSASIVPIEYKDYKINLIDLPGNDDFVFESMSVLRAVKGAVLLVDASSGIQVGTVKHFKMLRKRGVPTIIYINKMDKENISFDKVLEEIREKFGKIAVPFCYPMGTSESFDGFINCVDLVGRKSNGASCVDCEIPASYKDKVDEIYNMICESVAESDEALLDKFFGGEELTTEEIHNGLRKGVLSGDLLPVLLGSTVKNIGLHTLLDMFISYLPQPTDLKPIQGVNDKGETVIRKTEDSEPFSAFVFKTICDPYAGVINLFKINSGKISIGDEIYCPQTGVTQKINSLFIMCGNKQIAQPSVGAGDIAGIAKLNGISSSMTICDPKNVITYKPISYPTAVYFKAIMPKNKADEDKLSQVLQKIRLEDPTLEVKRNVETKQLLLGGLGISHIAYVIDKMKNTYKVEVNSEDPRIVYRETIKQSAEAWGRYVKQSGGSGFYGVVQMKFEPSKENEFTETIFGGSVPKNYFPAVEKGFYEAIQTGLLAGFPVEGIKATLQDGKWHPVDSNELAFKMAAILAFKEAYMNCKPSILEPIMKVTVSIDPSYIGDVLSDLNGRRGKVQNMEEKEDGSQEIVAFVPEAEIISYATDLKALTQSSGFFNREFKGYEEVPAFMIDKVIADNKVE